MWNLKYAKLINTENRLLVARDRVEVSKISKGNQKIKMYSYNIIKSWQCNVQESDYK